MSRRSITITFVYLLITTAVAAALPIFFEFSAWASIALLGVAWAFLGCALFYVAGHLVVDELSVAIIFERDSNNFAYFIDSNPSSALDPKRPFNRHTKSIINRFLFNRSQFHHFINPFTERVEDWITKRPLSVSGISDTIRTREGIPLTIHWTFGYNLDPVLIRPGIERNLARALPKYSSNMISGRVLHSLRYIVEQMSVNELYRQDAIKNLEKVIREEVNRRTQNLGFVDIAPVDVRIGPIQVPRQVEKAIEAAHERELQTTTAVRALEQLRLVVSRFEQSDMDRLSELERLRILEEHGGSLIYSISSLMKSVEKTKTTHAHHNGE